MSYRYSAIDVSTRCLQKYKYEYLDGHRESQDNNIDLHFGTSLHAGLQAMLESHDYESVFNLYWLSLNQATLSKGNYDWADLSNLGHIFLERFKRLHFKHYNWKYLEQSMEGVIGNHKITGTADVIGEYKGKRSIIDFKTSFREYSKEKIQVNPQMYLYAELAKQSLGYEAEQLVYVVFIKSEKRIQVITTELKETHLQKHLDNVKLICDDLATRKDYPKNFNSCMMGTIKCQHYNKCWGDKK